MVIRVSFCSTTEGCSERNTLHFIGSHVRKELMRSFADHPEQIAGSDNRTARPAATSPSIVMEIAPGYRSRMCRSARARDGNPPPAAFLRLSRTKNLLPPYRVFRGER